MIRLLVAAASAVGLILLVAYVASRLVRARTRGTSIRLQVFLALAGIVGAFAFGLGILVLDRIEARATLLAEDAARDEAAAIAAVVGGELDARGASLGDVGGRIARSADPDALHFSLLDPAGHPVFRAGPARGERGTVFVTAPILVQSHVVGQVEVVKPTLVITRTLTDFAPTVLAISLVLGAAAAAAAVLIGRSIARPIEALTDFAVRVSEGERRAPPPPAFGREVQRLSRAIDSMRRQLEGRPFVETFAADLSHELKNPVAAIRASAEVLADGALEEPEEAARFVGRIQQATERIEALLGDLLNLARIEARGVEDAAVVDLDKLARDAASQARERGAIVHVSTTGAVTVRGSALWLSRAIENLLDNAVTHGEPGEAIHVSLLREGDEVRFIVRSHGRIHPHVAGRLFRRFVTTRVENGGTGLGLAIVRAIAEAHSGSAECAESGPPEVSFRITLPAAKIL
ncbi:histidine kinase dimerization/phospho-acceptor domain-containing protein [Polyangium sp. 15x6]|uniref:histidine kinase dimerization/phospho-acceptor domain-containing protein n=1 Tax=Polyangium sp. 15x6 TaxID=3042687 RepID=UPI00249BFF8A|nr:histidine kinase dimerization/phospho-acceptor domain-containing protein [Polyangium sp. 15x6]MDI3292161.1 histidine kinase dimerization/phospho-acceptor domain-containing protein [Polyangium sp. 15x6]